MLGVGEVAEGPGLTGLITGASCLAEGAPVQVARQGPGTPGTQVLVQGRRDSDSCPGVMVGRGPARDGHQVGLLPCEPLTGLLPAANGWQVGRRVFSRCGTNQGRDVGSEASGRTGGGVQVVIE